jgi:3-phosphoshikimate 1-carboxyvinyltransferase
MGCTIKRDNGNVSVKGPEKLIGIEADMSSMPDSVQTLTVVSLFSNGATKIRNIGNLKFKESDRINDTAEELRKLEANVTIKDNELIIKPAKLNPATIDPHNDHRMAMSFALAGLKMGIKIENPECVSKSFPQYWGKLRELGVEIKNA